MKRYRVVRRADALEDIVEHGRYYVRKGSPETARRFVKAARAAVLALSRTPLMGRRWESPDPALAGVRVWHIKGFPDHLIFYRSHPKWIEIIHVFHGAQDIPAILRRRGENDSES